MKEFIIIFIALTIIIGGGIYSQKYLTSSTLKIKEKLDSLKQNVEHIEDLSDVKNEYEEIYQNWQNEKDKWSIIVLHDEIDEIEEYLKNIEAAIKTNDKNQIITNINLSLLAINHIKEKEKLSLINIF